MKSRRTPLLIFRKLLSFVHYYFTTAFAINANLKLDFGYQMDIIWIIING